MTQKELRKLRRQEVLQLLLAQSEELEQLKTQFAETEDQLEQMTANYERLRKRLDQKDAQIHGLREVIEKQRTERRIQLDEAGSIAEAALRLNHVFEAAQKAAEQYLYNIQARQQGQPENEFCLEEELQAIDRLDAGEEQA